MRSTGFAINHAQTIFSPFLADGKEEKREKRRNARYIETLEKEINVEKSM